MTAKQAEKKYYVITRGKRESYVAIVHQENCPLLKNMKNARIWNRNPLDENRFNNYRRCQRCWPKGN